MSGIDYLVVFLIIVGTGLLFGFPVTYLAQDKKFEKDDYTINLFLPTTIALVCIFIAILINFNIYYDERKISWVSGMLAIGGIGIALMASHFSELRVYYATLNKINPGQ